jgi:hypothetical protein
VIEGYCFIKSSTVLYKATSPLEHRNKLCPLAANISAIALPIPLDAPVITTFIKIE